MLRLLAPCTWAGTITLNFDDVATPDGADPIGSPYHGFMLDSNWYAVNNSYYDSTYGNTVSFPSAPNVAFNAFGTTSINAMNMTTPMSLVSLSAAWWAENNAFFSGVSSTSLTIQAFNAANVLVGSATVQLGTDFTVFNVNLPAAVSWNFINSGGTAWWLADDMTFSTGTTTPEPAAIGLLSVAGLGLMLFRKKIRA